MHTISSYRDKSPTNTHEQSHRQDRLQYAAPLSLTCSVNVTVVSVVMKGCKSPLVVKFADTQREKDMKRVQTNRMSTISNAPGVLGMQAAAVCHHCLDFLFTFNINFLSSIMQ